MPISTRMSFSATVTVALPLLLALGLPRSTADTSRYAIVDLGTLGGPTSEALGINNAGQVVGATTDAAGGNRAFLWTNGTLRDLGTEHTIEGASAAAINGSGQVAGSFSPSVHYSLPFRWTNGSIELAPFMGVLDAFAKGINDAGQIVGWFFYLTSPTSTAFVWTKGTLETLPTLGGPSAFAFGINSSGQIAGESKVAGGTPPYISHAVLWSNGGPQDLKTLGGRQSFAQAINDAGQVVGGSETASGASHAFRWTQGVMLDLGSVGGFSSSEAEAINGSGAVVGIAYDPEAGQDASGHAFLYTDAAGMADLNASLPAGSGWELRAATGINDAGQVVGWGLHQGQRRAFLLTARAATAASADRITVFRPRTGEWFLREADGSDSRAQFGAPGDEPVPADYLGTGHAQIAVFRPATAQWFLRDDAGSTIGPISFGQPGDRPVPADYLGLGHAQIAIFRPATGRWLIRTVGGGVSGPFIFGRAGDLPAPADYLGIGKAQLSIFRPSRSTAFGLSPTQWRIRYDNGFSAGPAGFGEPGSVPLPGDYLGLGHAQIAVFEPPTATWSILDDSGSVVRIPFGGLGDVPVPGDYTGSLVRQIAVYRPSTGEWFFRQGDRATSVRWGGAGDAPVPARFADRFGSGF